MNPTVSFAHVIEMTDDIGMFEHADHLEPRREHGYCTDDMARLLIVVAREPAPDAALQRISRTALSFLIDAQAPSGRVRNRRTTQGGWEDTYGVEDCWGRSVWAFGTAARRLPDAALRQVALHRFERGAAPRSPWRRSMAFAALGAAEVLVAHPSHSGARHLLADAATTIGTPADDAAWPWPEPRLTYANAVLPEALIAAGDALGRPDVLEDGLTLLRWLLDRETAEDHLSPTPVGGAGPGDAPGRFDQQPIEVATMADACARAAAVTGDTHWLQGVDMAVAWFAGHNDAGRPMWDPMSGGGFDGLEPGGANLNEGAESTLALISTLRAAKC